jgi:Holliday junction resolvase RusA-like endonuclease
VPRISDSGLVESTGAASNSAGMWQICHKPRAPLAVRRMRLRSVINPRNYTPTTHPVNAFKALAKLAYAKRASGGPAEGPLALSITFIMPRPKNKVWKQKPMPRYCHTKKPDLDNLVKAVLDALNGLASRDDAQIHTLHISKVVAAGDEQPHVQVRIAEEDCA